MHYRFVILSSVCLTFNSHEYEGLCVISGSSRLYMQLLNRAVIQYSCPSTTLQYITLLIYTLLYLHCFYILPHMIACSVTLDSSVLLCLADAGSLWERRQFTLEQLSINRSSTRQVSHREICVYMCV